MEVGAALAAADAGEGGNGVPVAVAVTERKPQNKARNEALSFSTGSTAQLWKASPFSPWQRVKELLCTAL